MRTTSRLRLEPGGARGNRWKARAFAARIGGACAGAFTLVELLVVVAVLGVLSAVVIPRLGGVIEDSRTAATREEMQRLRAAITGDAALASGGRLSSPGYAGDVGALPPDLEALVTRPPAVDAWDPYAASGWHGPYVDSTGGDFLKDAWGSDYDYDPLARTITSSGSGSDIVLGF